MNHIVHGRFNQFADYERPFRFEAEVGKTVAEIVAAAPETPDWFWHSGEVRINGKRVERGAWHIVRPKLSTSLRPVIITLHEAYGDPGGGGGGGGAFQGKNLFRTVGAIALIAAAALVSGGLLGPAAAGTIGTGLFSSASFAAGGLAATAIAAGLSLGATLLLTTIAPPPISTPSPRGGDADTRQLSDAGISGNSLKPMQALPVILGRIRFSPPFGSPPYTTLENGVVFANAVYVVAGHYDITDIMVNGISIDEFAEIEYQVRTGSHDDAILTICDESVIERRNQNALLTNFSLKGGKTDGDLLAHQDNPDQDISQEQIFKTAGIVDEARIRLFMPAIQWTDETGVTPPTPAIFPIRTEIRQRGTSTWLKLPTTHWQAYKLNQQLRKEIRIIWAIRAGPRENNPDLNCAAAYYITGNGQTFQYTAESYFAPITVTDQIPVMTAATTSGVTMSASTQGVGEEAWRAADSSLTSQWEPTTIATDQWIKVDFGSAKLIRSYLMNQDFEHCGRAWVLEGSNDDAAWTAVSTITNSRRTGDPISIQCDNPGSYRYYRLTITEYYDTSYQLEDFQMYLHDAPGSDAGAIFASNVHIHDDGIDIYLDPAVFPPDEYEIKLRRGWAVQEPDFDRTNYTWNAVAANADFFEYFTDNGEHKIRESQTRYTTDTLIESIATVSDDYPFHSSIHQKGVAMIAVRAPSVTLESLSAIFHSIVPVWSAANDWSVDAASSNPAALARHVLLNTEQNAEALPGELIDEATFQEFYEFCDVAGHEFNGVVEGQSVIEVYRQVLAGGYGAPDWPGFWSVIWEYDRSAETPVQMFTPLDTRGLTVSKSFPRLPHAFRPIYFNEDNDWALTEDELVYMDGFNEHNTTRIEEINLPGWTNSTKVAERALFDLRQLHLRPTRVSFEINLAGLACSRNDLVILRHDVISRYHDFSRIISVQKSGGNIIGLTLESKVDLSIAVGEVEENMAAVLQFTDRTTSTHQVNEKTLTDVVTFTTPFVDPDDGVVDEDEHLLKAGMTAGFGVVSTEDKRMVVLWYEYVNELTRRITLVDEAPGLHAT